MSQQVEEEGAGWEEGKTEKVIQNSAGVLCLCYGSESRVLELQSGSIPALSLLPSLVFSSLGIH